MPKRWNLTLYRLQETIGGKPSDFRNVIRNPRDVKFRYPAQPENFDFKAQVVLSVSESQKPSWVELFADSFDDLKLPKSKRVDGLLLVQVEVDGKMPLFAFSFGQGRHLLEPASILPAHGLEVALNAMYNDTEEKNQIRSVDSKTIAGNIFNTRRQADRRTSFDSFSVDSRRDFLRSITGRPSETDFWGTRLSGSHGLSANPEIDFSDLGRFCKKVFATHTNGIPADFSWTEKLKLTVDMVLKHKLLNTVVVNFSKFDDLTIAVPELVEWENISHFSINCMPDVTFLDPEDFDLEANLNGLKRPKEISVANMRKWKLEAFDLENQKTNSWPLISCLSGQFDYNRKQFVISEGDFYEVDDSFLEDLDDFVNGIKETKCNLPNTKEDPKEEEYNKSVANSSENYLLLDQKMVKLDNRTSAVEACDLLDSNGAFIHVKRKLNSSSLSHLFAQGYISAYLLLTSHDFRAKLNEKILDAEEERAKSEGNDTFKGKFPRFNGQGVDPKKHEIVYAIAAVWNKKSLTKALPFFSKINLRHYTEELRRLGYLVTYAKIETTHRQK